MAIQTLTRTFKLKDVVLADPDINWSEKQVKEFYSAQYPELNNANISAPEYTEDAIVYNFETNLGTKG